MIDLHLADEDEHYQKIVAKKRRGEQLSNLENKHYRLITLKFQMLSISMVGTLATAVCTGLFRNQVRLDNNPNKIRGYFIAGVMLGVPSLGSYLFYNYLRYFYDRSYQMQLK